MSDPLTGRYHRDPRPIVSRRDLLSRMGAGFGTLALAGLLGETGAKAYGMEPESPLAPGVPHFAPRAKRVIQLFMPGGPSQVDTFDHKPLIDRHAGERPALVDRKSLRNTKGGLLPSPFGFRRYGATGKAVSDIFPKVAEHVDEICFVHSMHTDIPEHAGAILMMNLGHIQPTRPSVGSWLVYGLGSESEDLPGFVAMSPRAQPRGKLANWGNSFLPGAYAGSYINIHSMQPGAAIPNLAGGGASRAEQRRQLDLLERLNRLDAGPAGSADAPLEASIQAMEMAFRMQFAVPEVFDQNGLRSIGYVGEVTLPVAFRAVVRANIMKSPTTRAAPDGTPLFGPDFVVVDFDAGRFTFDPSFAGPVRIFYGAEWRTYRLPPVHGIYKLQAVNFAGVPGWYSDLIRVGPLLPLGGIL